MCCAICSQKITGHYGTALGAGVHLELMGCVEALTQRAEAAEAELAAERNRSDALLVLNGDLDRDGELLEAERDALRTTLQRIADCPVGSVEQQIAKAALAVQP